MGKYTVKQLIKILSKFPEDCPITNNLCIIWDDDTIPSLDVCPEGESIIAASQRNAKSVTLA